MGGHDDVIFRVPAHPAGTSRNVVVDTADETQEETERTLAAGDKALVVANSFCLLVMHSQVAG